MIRRPPRATRTEHSFPTRRSSDLRALAGHAGHRRRRYEVGLDAVLAAGGGEAAGHADHAPLRRRVGRSEEHTSELQSLMRISYAVFCLKKKNKKNAKMHTTT